MRRFLLDTSIMIFALRGRHEAKTFIQNLSGDACSSFICISELYEGVNRVANKKEIEQGVLDLCSGLAEIYGIDMEIAKKFGQIKVQLQTMGTVIDDLDLLIAATCLAYHLILVTENVKHFKLVAGLELISINPLSN